MVSGFAAMAAPWRRCSHSPLAPPVEQLMPIRTFIDELGQESGSSRLALKAPQ